MLSLPDHIMQPLKRVNRVYFTDPERILALRAGETLVHRDEKCTRLYLVLRGTFAAYRHIDHIEGSDLPPESQVREQEAFRAEPRSYVCVQSFFSRSYCSSYHIVALEDAEVAYIDNTTAAVEPALYGSLEQQFVPVLVHELAARNSRIFTHLSEKEEAVRLLQRAEMASTLAQLSAGIAHELNNAVGVIARRTDFIADNLATFLREGAPHNEQLFRMGYEDAGYQSSAELRQTARSYEHELNLPQEAAKVLAHAAPDTQHLVKLGPEFVDHIRLNYRFWELGHDLHDLRQAARHAAGIVRAVKLLGGGTSTRENGVDVNQSLRDALNLLTDKLKAVRVRLQLDELPAIYADPTELVQIWVNIISNACDAMSHAETPDPTVSITSAALHANGLSVLPHDYVTVSICNNGPEIPAAIRDKIFQPNFTTKKKGLDFGLGLGLSIVRRLADSYGATIELQSSASLTSFTINLPTIQIHGND